MSVPIRAALLAVFLPAAFAQSPPLVRILGDELERNFRVLREKADPPPYYMAYEVTETETAAATASLGALKSSRSDRARVLDITIRVGSPKLDNYHRIRGQRVHFAGAVALPIEDSEPAIRRQVWLETDRIYRLAAERLIKIRTNQQVKVAEEDDSDDFSQEEPATYFEPMRRLNFPLEQAAARARKLSTGFGPFAKVVTSFVSVMGSRETTYFVNTEGTRLQHGHGLAMISFAARTKAADGMDIVNQDSVDAEEYGGLPADEHIQKALGRVGELTSAMLLAPVVEPYVGPALLSGRAAAVLFHEIFGHRVEGHRQKDETEGQTFTKSVGSPVLPDFISVVFDPTRRRAEGRWLNGSYAYDDEGVKGQPVTVVEKGVLKTFLMSRSPIKGFLHSNGHGRRQAGNEVVSRQSNLFVESSQPTPSEKLRQMLLAEVRRQNKPYGLLIDQVTGGYTSTGRQGVQAFKVVPLVVLRIYADGRRDELVRGADIVGTPLASFAKIVATGSRLEVFNGFCGAESGSVPVAAVSPAILVSELEIQKTSKSDERPPLLPAPWVGGGQ
jgi:TldD protein